MEFSILKSSEVKSENATFRLDAEFFRKEYRRVVGQVEKKQFSYVDNICSWVTQGPNPIFSEDGLPCLTGRNINKGEVSYADPDYISEQEYLCLSRYQLHEGDTLITLKGKGSIGKVGFVTNDRKAIFSRDIGIIRPSNVNPGYLNMFFLCKYGKLLVDRGETGGTGQSTLTTSYLKAIPVPRFGEFEEQIGSFLNKVDILKRSSSDKYDEAESFLLSELGLLNWQPKHQLSFVRNYSDTDNAERIDAEHFQPKYDELMKIIRSAAHCKRVGEIAKFNARGLQPKYNPEGQIKVVNSQHILDDHLDYDNFEKTDEQSWNSQKKAHIFQNDILIYTTGANIGRTNVYLIKDKCLASNHVNILRLKKENQIYVGFVMNSIIGRMQTQKYKSGAAQAELYPSDLEEFIIPFAKEETQNRITELVISSLNKKIQSKAILNFTKRAVEIAIEQNEDAAMKWLQEQTKKVGTEGKV